MTQVLKMTAPQLEDAKDPNDARNDPQFRRYLETEVKGIATSKNGVIDLSAYRASDKTGIDIPPREWIWKHWASAGVVTGLSGPPGVAKSLLAQQIGTHAAIGLQLLGSPMSKVPALHVTCEDDEDELDRRQIQICDAIGTPLPDDLHLMSWVGEETLLVFQENGSFSRTARFTALDEYIGDNGIKCATLDLIPDFWNGNEINRTHVNAFVKSHLAYLARRHKAAIIPLFHPSKAGMADGTGTSGSTAWEGSFRGRIYMSRPKDDDIKSPDRIISRPKANYSSLDEKEMTWRDGYLWEKGTDKEEDREQKNVQIFLEILQYCETKEMEISPANNSPNYFGKTFPQIWKSIDGRHTKITKRAMENAYIKCQMDGVTKELPPNNRGGKRIKFIGYGDA